MIINLLTEEEERRRKEEEKRKRQEEEDRRRREEEERRQEEERKKKAEEERKRKEEEERKRREEEERERKRQKEEERQRKAEEERKRREEERANDPRNWPTFMLVFRFTALCAYSKLSPQMVFLSSPDSYEVPSDERDSVGSGIGCVVRAKPGSCSPRELKEKHLKCSSLEWTADSAVPEYYMEEVISNLICLQSAVGYMTFPQVRKENLVNS